MGLFTDDQIAVLSANVVRVAPLIRMDFRDTTYRLWNGNYELDAGGQTWLPLKGSGSISGIPMQTGLTSDAVDLSLSGIADDQVDILSTAFSETAAVQQQTALIALQLFGNSDADLWQPIGAPINVFYGFMQPPKVTRSPMSDLEGGSQTLTISLENALFGRSRPPGGRYTDRDQQFLSPGDQFFQFVSSLQNKTFTYPDY